MSFADFATKKIATGVSNNLNLEDPATRKMLIEQLGLQDQKPQLNLLERIIAPLDMFRITDDIRKGQKEGILAGIGDFLMDIPKAIGGAITGEDFRDQYDKEGANEILKDMGVENEFVRGVGGFIGDVLLDPTTYVTIGTGAGAKILTKGGAKVLTKSGTKLAAKVESNLVKEFAEKSVDDIAKIAAENGLEGVFKIGGNGGLIRELTSKKMIDFADKGASVLKSLGLEESNKLVQQVLKEGVLDKGGFKFMGKKIFDLTPKTEGIAKAYIDPLTSAYKGAKQLPFGIGGAVEKAGTGISETLGKTVGGIRKLFDRKYALADGNMGRYGQLLERADQVGDYLKGVTDTRMKHYRGVFENVVKIIEEKDIATLPHLLEQLPESKIKLLPKEIQESINRLMEDIPEVEKQIAKGLPIGTKSSEQFIEKSEGWKAGTRDDFDLALYNKDAKKLKELLPTAPEEYKQRFAKEIDEIISGKVDVGLPDDTRQILKNIEEGMPEEQKLLNEAQKNQMVEQVQKSPLSKIGKSKTIINKQGVKKKVFEPVISSKQVEVLNSYGITDAKSMEKFVKNKLNFVPEDIPYKETKYLTKQMSWARADKAKEVMAVNSQIEALKSNPQIAKMLDQFDSNEKLATSMGEDQLSLVDRFREGTDPIELKYADQIEKTYGKHQKYEKALRELEGEYKEKLAKSHEMGKEVTTAEVQMYKAGMTPQDKLIKEMGITPSKFKQVEAQIIKAGKQAEKFAKKSEELIEKKITDTRRMVDPELRDWFEKDIEYRNVRTEWDVEHGYIKGKAKASYIGRELLQTPSGKIIDKVGKEMGVPKSSMKSMLDPKSVIQQKHRFYDNLIDLERAGGVTTITKEKGKKQLAAIIEQEAKDDILHQTAVSFEGFGQDIVNGKVKDAAGNKLYYATAEIVDALPDKLKGLEKQIDHFKATGEVGEALKSRLDKLGYKKIDLPIFKDAWFDEETYKVITKIQGAFFNDETMNDFVKLYDKVHNLIKKSQTVWFPAFHVRNAISNTFVNMTAGLTNPDRYFRALDVQIYMNALDKGNKEIIKKYGEKKIGNFTLESIYNMAKYNGVTTTNFFSEMADDLIGKQSLLNKASVLNPLSSEFALQKGGRLIEENARLALFIDRLLKGDDIRSAALKVKEVLFDYADLTDFEKNVLKKFIPYYTWTRKNAEQMLKMIAFQPGKFSAIMKGFKGIQQAFSNLSEEDQAKLPDWVKTGIGMSRKTGEDQATVVTSFGLPIEAFEQLLTTNIGNQLGVMPKTAIEVMTGKNIFKNKDILDDNTGQAYKNLPQFIKDRIGYREETRTTKDGRTYTLYTVDPWAKYYMNVLFGRSVSTASKGLALGESGDTTMDIVNLLSGVKKYDFDLTAEAEKRNREQTQKLYDSLARMGLSSEYTSQYMSKDQKSDLLKRIGQ